MLREELHVAVPTAFLKDESLNVQGTIDHIRYLYDKGIKSVLVCGSTGEQHSMNLEEKITLLNAISTEEELINKMEILFGVSSVRQSDAIKLAEAIGETKIAGILLGYPPYILPTQEEALRYSKKIIESCNKPTVIYNNLKRTGFDLSIESVVQLNKLEKVIGIKEAGDKTRVKEMKKFIEESFYYYAGGEADLEDKLKYGFNRLSSITGNIYPCEIHKWFYTLLSEQPIKKDERAKIASLTDKVLSGSPLDNLKKKINEKGIEMGICRSPLGNE